MSAGVPLVQVEGLVHIYKAADLEVVALQGLDLTVAAGETVAVVGRSGSGKTTLMNVLAGGERPSAGRVTVAGHDLTRLTAAQGEAYRREVIGYLWQHANANLLPELSAEQNVQMPMIGSGAARQRADQAGRLLAALGLEHHASRKPAQLTGGENQRLALAVALANRPALLLADEPTAELDGVTARLVLADLSRLLQELETAAILVTHDRQVARFVDRVVQIRDGRTSTETRYVEHEGDLIADEVVILDRAGRLQLPRHLIEELGLRERVRVHSDGGSLRISPLNGPAPR